ncbi:MAG: carbohydrate ABC transporter permease [Spirochaetota bacterium]
MLSYRFKRKAGTFLVHCALILACLAVVLPLLWIFRTSLVHRVLAYQIPPKWLFRPVLDNYRIIFNEEPFVRFFINSMVIAVSSTLLCLIIGAPAAFSYSRFRTGGNTLRVSMLSTQMLPAITLVIPFFLIYRAIGLYNTRLGMVITYITFNIPFIVWILIGFFEGIPKELDESAMVDGCTRFSAFVRIIVPVSLPGVLSAGVFSFVLSWNEFLFALILTGRRSKTLPVAVSGLITQQGVQIGAVCAAIVLIILPMIILYFGLRSFLIRGMVAGAVKE